MQKQLNIKRYSTNSIDDDDDDDDDDNDKWI